MMVISSASSAIDGWLHTPTHSGAALAAQSIPAINPETPGNRSYLTESEVAGLVRRIAPDCASPFVVGRGDDYPITSSLPDALVYRSICGDVWFQIDSANGVMLERLDGSRRAYRSASTALHTLDLPVLLAHPLLRSDLIVVSCTIGFFCSR